MRGWTKILIGLLAALAAASIWYGPAGGGEAIASRLESQARTAVAQADLPGVDVNLERSPLRRSAVVAGKANDIQREGMGGHHGVLDYARVVPGMASARWSDQPAGGTLPLLAEILLLSAAAFALGLGLGALLGRRRRRHSYLD